MTELSEDFALPDPHESVNETHVRNLSATRLTAQIERRAENTRFHDRIAKKAFRQFIASIQSMIKRLEWELSQLRPRLSQLKKLKSQLERFGSADKRRQKDKKQPATRWIQSQFAGVLAMLVLAVANGTFTVSAMMLDSTAFSGKVAKTITIALGFFVAAPLAISFPFHLLKRYRRLAYSYFAFILALGMVCYLLFALTWAHTYAIDTGNEAMIDLTSIGMVSEGDSEEDQPWIFREANWISLLMQILADACLAGAAKCYLTFLTWGYALFRDKAFAQDEEWKLLDSEEREQAREIAELEAQKKLALERLEDLEDQQAEYSAAVCSLADALFLREVDTYEHKRDERDRIEQEVAEKEQEWRRSRHLLDAFVEKNPGVQKGRQHEEIQ